MVCHCKNMAVLHTRISRHIHHLSDQQLLQIFVESSFHTLAVERSYLVRISPILCFTVIHINFSIYIGLCLCFVLQGEAGFSGLPGCKGSPGQDVSLNLFSVKAFSCKCVHVCVHPLLCSMTSLGHKLAKNQSALIHCNANVYRCSIAMVV